MIEEIYIRDLGVIREARLGFGPGLTVLTGETGAGKTMVLSALGLLLGERAESGVVRQGQDQAFVEGRWLLSGDSNVISRIQDAGASVDNGEVIVNRSVSSEGRSRAAIGGTSTPIGVLSEIGEELVVVHGQADQIRLKSVAAQREALDSYAGKVLSDLLVTYRSHFDAWRAAAVELNRLTQELSSRAAEADTLREAVDELERFDPQPNEDEDLAEKANRLTHAEEIRIAVQTAHDLLSSEGFDAGDAISGIGKARRSLEQVTAHDAKLAELAENLKQLGYQLGEVAADLNGYLAGIEGEGAGELERVQARRADLQTLKRKYGPEYAEVLSYRERASNRLLELDSSTENIDRLTQVVAAELAEVKRLGAELSKVRLDAAAGLAGEVTQELEALAMKGSSLVVSVSDGTEYTSHGKDIVSIQLSAYPGAEPRPLGKGASGGELSRIMLAIEVVLAKFQVAPTFIFDEVDAGVGGAAAIEVGRRLARLAKQSQVIVVTHLAQVAAFAGTHLRVLKSVSSEYTASDVVSLDIEQRTEELARMLSGLSDSQTGRLHAAELLGVASEEKRQL
ncbi:MAG: repair protein RecN [Actinomycetota bacterium]